MAIDLNIFRGKRVLLTGHTGFKGSWLLVLLDRLGANVTGLSLPPETETSLFRSIEGHKLCNHLEGDIRDRHRVFSVVRETKPDIILHLAAQSLVRRSYRDPLETFDSNVTGTLNVLEAMRQLDGRCASVIVTTDKVYAESREHKPYTESDAIGGHDPYSSSKAACELLAQSYRLSYFSPDKFASHGKSIATARAGNVIGGGDWNEDQLFNDISRALDAGKPVRIRNPRAVRPWQHVLDCLAGYLRLGAALLQNPTQPFDAFNFGPDVREAVDVETLVKIAIDVWGSGIYVTDIDPNAVHEAHFLQVDSTRAHQHLHWKPKLNAKQAVKWTIEWYREARSNPLAYTKRQIQSYVDLGDL